MNFGQLNIFLEKSYVKRGRKTIPRTFYKKSYIWINILKFHIFCFNCLPIQGLSKVFETKLQTICFYLMQSVFKKQKEAWS